MIIQHVNMTRWARYSLSRRSLLLLPMLDVNNHKKEGEFTEGDGDLMTYLKTWFFGLLMGLPSEENVKFNLSTSFIFHDYCHDYTYSTANHNIF